MQLRRLAKAVPMQLYVPVNDLRRADRCDPMTNCLAAASASGSCSRLRALGILLFCEVARSIAFRSHELPRSRISGMPLRYDCCIFRDALAQSGGLAGNPDRQAQVSAFGTPCCVGGTCMGWPLVTIRLTARGLGTS